MPHVQVYRTTGSTIWDEPQTWGNSRDYALLATPSIVNYFGPAIPGHWLGRTSARAKSIRFLSTVGGAQDRVCAWRYMIPGSPGAGNRAPGLSPVLLCWRGMPAPQLGAENALPARSADHLATPPPIRLTVLLGRQGLRALPVRFSVEKLTCTCKKYISFLPSNGAAQIEP